MEPPCKCRQSRDVKLSEHSEAFVSKSAYYRHKAQFLNYATKSWTKDSEVALPTSRNPMERESDRDYSESTNDDRQCVDSHMEYNHVALEIIKKYPKLKYG